ncbi:secreted RxLR effector protein 161-like [Nicotiana tabacum]|uniref:Secreted RxLR effector protein 161-like n=1 Tax=Nicotiana tabacum TaxID=4097 RepID=A0AC58USI3_TOBAC
MRTGRDREAGNGVVCLVMEELVPFGGGFSWEVDGGGVVLVMASGWCLGGGGWSDIAYSVSLVSQFMHDPQDPHMQAVFHILRYLKSAPGKGLIFSKHGHLQIEAFTDADWAGSLDDRRSISGYCTLVGGNVVTWRSKKQNIVARSNAKAEYRAMAQGVCELWLQKLMDELRFSETGKLLLYCDNKAAISIVHNPVQHDRTKHVEID